MYECAYVPQLQLSRFIAHQLYCRPKARPYYQSQLQNEYQRLFFLLLLVTGIDSRFKQLCVQFTVQVADYYVCSESWYDDLL